MQSALAGRATAARPRATRPTKRSRFITWSSVLGVRKPARVSLRELPGRDSKGLPTTNWAAREKSRKHKEQDACAAFSSALAPFPAFLALSFQVAGGLSCSRPAQLAYPA